MAKDQHGLTVKEMQFIINRISKGMDLGDCFKKYKPDTKQGKENRARSGWATMDIIKNKCGGWKSVYSMAGLGPDRISKIYEDALKANNDKGKADHHIRLKAAENLKDIHGLSEETINIHVDPLPLVVIMEKAKEKDDE